MSEWKEIFRLAFVLTVLIIIIGIVISLVFRIQTNFSSVNNEVSSKNEEYKRIDYTQFDNRLLTGGETAAFIYKHYGVKDIGIIVDNGYSSACYIRGLSKTESIFDFDDSLEISSVGKISSNVFTTHYIKSSDFYLATLCENKNGTIIGVQFSKADQQS